MAELRAPGRGVRVPVADVHPALRGRVLPSGVNLYSRAPNAFDEQARRIAGLFGVQAALLLYGAHHAAQLSQALESRSIIEQAKGYLARRHGGSPEEAFITLRAYARRNRRRLHAVAEDVVHQGLDLD